MHNGSTSRCENVACISEGMRDHNDRPKGHDMTLRYSRPHLEDTQRRAKDRMVAIAARTRAGHELTATDREVFDAAEAEHLEATEALRALDARDAMGPELQRVLAAADGPYTSDSRRSFEDFMKRAAHQLDLAGQVISQVERRDILTTTTGAPVPTQMANQIVRRLIESSGVLAAGPRLIRTDNGETWTLPTVTTYGTASIISEGSAVAESDPTLAQVTFKAHKFGVVAQASFEMLADAVTDFEAVLGESLGNAISQAVAPKLANGTGTVEPVGIMSGAYATAVTGGTGVAGKATYANLVDLVFSLPAAYRTNAAWLMSDTTLAGIAKLTDSNGQPLLIPAMSQGAPTTLFGKPVHTDANIADAAVNAKSIFFGDVGRAFGVRFAGPLDLVRSDEYAFVNALSTWRCMQRLDSQVIDVQAGRFYRGGTA